MGRERQLPEQDDKFHRAVLLAGALPVVRADCSAILTDRTEDQDGIIRGNVTVLEELEFPELPFSCDATAIRFETRDPNGTNFHCPINNFFLGAIPGRVNADGSIRLWAGEKFVIPKGETP